MYFLFQPLYRAQKYECSVKFEFLIASNNCLTKKRIKEMIVLVSI